MCLNDVDEIQKAIEKWRDNEEQKYSIIDKLCQNDQMRKRVMEEINQS